MDSSHIHKMLQRVALALSGKNGKTRKFKTCSLQNYYLNKHRHMQGIQLVMYHQIVAFQDSFKLLLHSCGLKIHAKQFTALIS